MNGPIIVKSAIFKKLLNCFGIVGTILFFLNLFILKYKGHGEFTSLLLLIAGMTYWISIQNDILKKFLLSFLISSIVLIYSPHSVWTISVIFPFAAILYFDHTNIRIPLILILFLCIVTTLLTLDFFRDANAIWRYNYWREIIIDCWKSGYFLLGKGFGIALIPENSLYYKEILNQVMTKDASFQVYSVPPHNGLLTILLYLGLPGLILFLYPYFQGLILGLKKKLYYQSKVYFIILTAYFFLLMTNQFLEVPYTAMIFWLFYGLFYQSITVVFKGHKKPILVNE